MLWLPCTPFLCVLFERSLAPRALHSFPTRRSSDLRAVHDSAEGKALSGEDAMLLSTTYDEFVHQGALLSAGQKRSEEHTSELQSPCNLVCRLLLEKKKKKHDTTDRTENQLEVGHRP